jgi:8-oxo-dGTP pyrophosphatase MutT (NUDIX family)
MEHPLHLFRFCPRCGSEHFEVNDFKSKHCADCGFTYYYNAAAAVVAFVVNGRGELLVCRRACEPARGTMDLPGGFVDAGEPVEAALVREVQEETNLSVASARYLFSLSDDYLYSGFLVRSCDSFFLCRVKDEGSLRSGDDAADCRFVPLDSLKPADFGLISVRRGVERFLRTEGLRLRAGQQAGCVATGGTSAPQAVPHDNAAELLPWVDEEGQMLGVLTRGECHGGSHLLHPVVHLHVFDAQGEALYLQRRPLWKDIQPGKWDTAVGGHIDLLETPEQALRREAREELGIEGFDAEFVTRYVFESARERELVHVFRTTFEGALCPSAELDGGRFWPLREIRAALGSGVFTPNFESEFITRLEPLLG